MHMLETMPRRSSSTTTQSAVAPMLPGVHSYLMNPGHHRVRLPRLTPSLPSLPSVFGSLTDQYLPSDPPQVSSSISFLLNPIEDTRSVAPFLAPAAPISVQTKRVRPRPSSSTAVVSPVSTNGHDSVDEESLPQGQLKKKRKARICKAEGCEKYVVDRGLCIRHGGGKRCSVDECNCRAQNRGLCWKHGGYTRCTVEGCTKRAKSRGICWSHGGGTRCKHANCSKIAVSHGLCWAHGGGKRCLVESCQKPAYERNGNLCAEHCSSAASG